MLVSYAASTAATQKLLAKAAARPVRRRASLVRVFRRITAVAEGRSSRSAHHAAIQATALSSLPRAHAAAAMPPKGVDDKAREAMTQKIAQRLTTMQAVEDPIAAAQIEAK